MGQYTSQVDNRPAAIKLQASLPKSRALRQIAQSLIQLQTQTSSDHPPE
jgi:hypothetical protein